MLRQVFALANRRLQRYDRCKKIRMILKMEGGGNGRYRTGQHRLSGTSQGKGETQLAQYTEMIRKLVLDYQEYLTAEEIFAELKKYALA